MKQTSRFSIFWFLMWSLAIVLVASGVGDKKTPAPAVAISSDLVQEIEGLEAINQLNAGQMDASGVAVQGQSESKAIQAEAHRSLRRPILSP